LAVDDVLTAKFADVLECFASISNLSVHAI